MFPTKLYWVLSPIENLRQAVETAKRILTKEKIDRQSVGQSSSTPFMSIKDSYNKRVTFNTQDWLEDNIDKLTAIMGNLVARDSEVSRPFKPQVYQSKQRGQSRNFYDSHNYDRGNYQNKYRWNSGDRRIPFNKQGRGRPRYAQNYRRGNFRSNARSYQHFRRQNSRGEYRGDYRNENYSRKREVGVDLEKGHFQEIIVVIIEGTIEVQAIVDQDQDQEQVWIEIELDVISVECIVTLEKIVLHPI